jgi:hypothetical protein
MPKALMRVLIGLLTAFILLAAAIVATPSFRDSFRRSFAVGFQRGLLKSLEDGCRKECAERHQEFVGLTVVGIERECHCKPALKEAPL